MSKIDGIDSLIFDLDGTLWDSTAACAQTINRQLQNKKINITPIKQQDVASAMGLPHNEYIEKVFAKATLEEKKILAQQVFDHTHISMEDSLLYDGVEQGINALSQQYPLYIVSNCESGYIENFLNISGLKSYFKDFECWGNTGQEKYKNIEAVIQRNNLQNPIYIGDTQGDKFAAEKAGVSFIAANYGFGQVEGLYTLNHFSELLELML
ncbi:MAG TPA: HAD family hydrolase [Oligoflexia bacterium]|nr:HAD family hydrolase [Oligoflexia bacterium]HMR23868.1 HAD family hydrolase [Oligoflexia bacterium]